VSERSFTPREVGAIVSAYTGRLLGEFSGMHEYVEKLMGGPVWTHEMGDPAMADRIRDLAKPDFLALHEWCGGKPAK
jgi:hypothetical protein